MEQFFKHVDEVEVEEVIQAQELQPQANVNADATDEKEIVTTKFVFGFCDGSDRPLPAYC